MSSQRPEGAKTDAGNPGTNGRFELDRKIPGSEGLGGGAGSHLRTGLARELTGQNRIFGRFRQQDSSETPAY
jgi:hypothetical protein